MSELRAIDRALTQELARSFPGADALALELAGLASAAIGEGHACLVLDDHAEREGWTRALRDEAAAALERWRAVASIARDGEPVAGAPLVLADRARLYLRRYWRYERDVAAALSRLWREPSEPPRDARAIVDALFAGEGPETDGQRAAVEHALAHRLTVILGGPGTGKTHTVLRVLEALLRAGLVAEERVVLAAPTGKAAARLNQSLHEAHGFRATTLHRLLGARPLDARVARGPDDPLDADVLVVDETSMVDLPLLAKTLAALPPSARVVLLGDPDQLASVEVGAVLGELAALGTRGVGAACVRLTHNFRAKGRPALADALAAVRAGDAEALLASLRANADGVRWLAGDERRREGLAIAAAWRGAVGAHEPPRDVLARLARSRVLCALREGSHGVAGLNQALQQTLGDEPVVAGEPPHGTPILILHNDPLSGLSNGDVGVVLRGADGPRAWFEGADGAPRALALGALPRFEPAHAMTVHKAQGSEFDRVLVVVPPPARDPRARGADIVTREWLYTALSRAREEAVLAATEESIRAALAQRSRRASGLAAMLATG